MIQNESIVETNRRQRCSQAAKSASSPASSSLCCPSYRGWDLKVKSVVKSRSAEDVQTTFWSHLESFKRRASDNWPWFHSSVAPFSIATSINFAHFFFFPQQPAIVEKLSLTDTFIRCRPHFFCRIIDPISSAQPNQHSVYPGHRCFGCCRS